MAPDERNFSPSVRSKCKKDKNRKFPNNFLPAIDGINFSTCLPPFARRCQQIEKRKQVASCLSYTAQDCKGKREKLQKKKTVSSFMKKVNFLVKNEKSSSTLYQHHRQHHHHHHRHHHHHCHHHHYQHQGQHRQHHHRNHHHHYHHHHQHPHHHPHLSALLCSRSLHLASHKSSARSSGSSIT